jgi:hypothetical protein
MNERSFIILSENVHKVIRFCVKKRKGREFSSMVYMVFIHRQLYYRRKYSIIDFIGDS